MASPARRAEFSRASNAAMAMAPHANLCTALDGGEDESSVLYMAEVLHAELRLSTLLARALSDGGFPWWAGASLIMDASKAVEALLQATPRKFSRYAVVEPDDFEVNTRGQLKLADAFAFLRQTSSPRVSLYRAPETWFRDRVDERSHVYVLGIWLWEFCSGKHLFLGGGSDAVMARTKAGVVPDLRIGDEGVPAALAAVIKKALAPSPLDRFERPAELAAALKDVVGSRASELTQFIQTTCADLTHVAGGLRSPQPEGHDSALTPLAVSIPILSADILPGSAMADDALVLPPAPAAEFDTGEHESARTQVLHTGDFAQFTGPHGALPDASAPSVDLPPHSEMSTPGTLVLKLSPEAEAQVAAKRAQAARPETLPPLSDLTDPIAADASDTTAPTDQGKPLMAPEPESQRTKFAPLETQAAAPVVPTRPGPSAGTSLTPPPPPGGLKPAPSVLGAPTLGAPTAKSPRKAPSKELVLGGIAAALVIGIVVLLLTGRGNEPDVVVDPSAQTHGQAPDSALHADPTPPAATIAPVAPVAPVAPTPPPVATHGTSRPSHTQPTVRPSTRPEPSVKEPAGEMGMMTIITTPACKLAVIDGASAGACPIVKKKVSAGVHVVKLVGPEGAVKTVALTVEAGHTTVKRETF